MQVRLYALVRELPDGRFLGASVDFPDLLAEGDDAPAALAALTTQLTGRLRRLGTAFRVGLGRGGEPELVRVPVDIPLGRKQETFSVTIPAIVVRLDGSGGELFRIRAAGIPQFEAATTRRDDVVFASARELAKELRHWPVDAVLALDDDGKSVTFEPLDLVLPPPPPGGVDEDDGDVLAATGHELTALAREGRLTPLDRRDDLVDRVLGMLASAKRSSVMLVGPRDVGKTTLVHEIAHRLVRGDVPASLRGRELWRVPANELIAGARYTGEWQERARQLVDAARDGPILMMGDPAGIVDAGRWSRSDNNLARFLRTYIESGEITVICESSPEVLAATHKKEPSFVDAFHRVEVPEPSPEQAAEILRAAAGRVGARLGLTVDESAIGASIELTRRFEPYRSLPGKALHLLEEAAQRQAAAGEPTTARDDVVGAFTTRTGLPLALLSDEAPLDLADVRAYFEERVLGQEDAVQSVVELVSVIKAGLNDPNKPLGTFFFVGPTGVGKTELAKALAEFLFGSRERMVRFDMGEFGAGDAIPRLIGTAWDSASEGELTRKVREQPFCVVLFDEIEKAHPAVFDALLSALGEGRLTDATGRTADFRNAILIMTSNLGSARRQSQAVGFRTGADDEKKRLREHYREQAERFFRPEFVNRIDRIVAFDALDQTVVRRIARREVGRLLLREGLVRRRLLVEVDDAAVTRLAEEGFDPLYGARPLQRQIERAVIQPLARLIVERRPPPGDIVRIHLRDGALAVDLESPPATREERREARRERRAAPTQASTARATDSVASVLAEIEADWTGPVAAGLRTTVAELIERTHTPTFWDDVTEARAVMSRIYGLERVLDRLGALLERASGLLELARHIQRASDRTRLSELRAAIGEIGDDLDLTRLELLGAAADPAGDGAASVRVNPIGAAGVDWAVELLAMYRAWAERTGRDVRERDDDAPGALLIDGPSTLQLLTGECGVHRRRLADRTELLARVLVTSPDGAAPADADPDVVVRVYEEGRRTGVKDPRTGTRSGALHDVLVEGRIEPFLVAALRDRGGAG